jgi:hypothetical protein
MQVNSLSLAVLDCLLTKITLGEMDYVKANLWTSGSNHGGAIKYDLDYVVR